MTAFFGDFAADARLDLALYLASEWGVDAAEFARWRVLVAFLDDDAYNAAGYFLLESVADGSLHEVYGTHCSCNGFDDEWQPTPVHPSYLLSLRHPTQNSATFRPVRSTLHRIAQDRIARSN